MLSIILLWLSRHLYPTGKIWKMPVTGYFEGLHIALAVSEASTISDCSSTLDSMLPDNENFTTQDASDWERRLGLPDGSSATLQQRMAIISSKMADSNVQSASALYLEWVLQSAGFDVYVYENLNNVSPESIVGTGFDENNEYGGFEFGEAEYGGQYQNIIANYIDEQIDWQHQVPVGATSTFFIGGASLGQFAIVPLVLKTQFRSLILKNKQTQDIGYLFINYQ